MNWEQIKVLIATAATLGLVGGGLYVVYENINVQIPKTNEAMANLYLNDAPAFAVLEGLAILENIAPPDAKTKQVGIYWEKITDDWKIIERLDAMGYVRVMHRQFDAVWITSKGYNEYKDFKQFLESNQPKTVIAPPPPSTTST